MWYHGGPQVVKGGKEEFESRVYGREFGDPVQLSFYPYRN